MSGARAAAVGGLPTGGRRKASGIARGRENLDRKRLPGPRLGHRAGEFRQPLCHHRMGRAGGRTL